MNNEERPSPNANGPSVGAGTLSASDALAFLNSRRQRASDPTRESKRKAYLRAASVLAGIEDIARLQPLEGAPATPEEAQMLLGPDLVNAPTEKFGGTVTLAAEARKEGLSQLGSPGAMIAALQANPGERTGPIQKHFEGYLRGTAPPIESQTLEDLSETLQALLWLDGMVPNLPAINDVRKRIEYLRLLQPFESIACDEVFRGRQAELDRLRDYVGVVEPERLVVRIRQAVRAWTQLPQQPALSIHGPGGVGKSALVARLMLEHTRLPEQDRIPFSYLDLDRPALDISDPLRLVAEMVRQVNLQFGGFERLYDFAEKNVRPVLPTPTVVDSPPRELPAPDVQADPLSDPSVIQDRVGKSISLLADLLGIMVSRLGGRPYLVVLDSFEEAQYRGEARVTPFWDVLKQIQQRAPFLRVVISGRAPVETLMLAGKPPLTLEVGDLDRDAAIAFLQARGVLNESLARRLVAQVGRVPLSLMLVAELVRCDPAVAGGDINITGNSRFWFSISDELIQGQLFARILGHIHNIKVKRLAHPGLTLRRITSDAIFNVLNEPCELDLTGPDEAQDLFEQLGRETALVTWLTDEDNRPTLIQRPELRRIMLKLLTQKSPAQVQQIHLKAASWYSGQTTLRSRAEALYHRLQLGQHVTSDEVRDPEIRYSLQTSLEELPLQSQLLLASYGFTVGADVFNRASEEQREQSLASQVEERLPYGRTAIEQAWQLIQPTVVKLDHPSPLYLSAARVSAEFGVDDVLTWLERGLDQAAAAGDTLRILELVAEKCWAVGLHDSKTQELPGLLDTLADYASRHGYLTYILQHHLQAIEVANTQGKLEQSEPLVLRLLAMIPTMDAQTLWGLMPVLGRSPLLPRIGENLKWMKDLFNAPGSVFFYAKLPPVEADRAFRELFTASTSWGTPSYDVTRQFVAPLQKLCSLWPYRSLRVQPAYGRSDRTLSESSA